MIKLTLTIERPDGSHRKIVVLGISNLNVERLKLGNPIYIHAEQLNISHDVMLMHGDTEHDIMAELKASGILPVDAKPDEPVES